MDYFSDTQHPVITINNYFYLQGKPGYKGDKVLRLIQKVREVVSIYAYTYMFNICNFCTGWEGWVRYSRNQRRQGEIVVDTCWIYSLLIVFLLSLHFDLINYFFCMMCFRAQKVQLEQEGQEVCRCVIRHTTLICFSMFFTSYICCWKSMIIKCIRYTFITLNY